MHSTWFTFEHTILYWKQYVYSGSSRYVYFCEKFFIDLSPIFLPNHVQHKRILRLLSSEPEVNFIVDVICARDKNCLRGSNQLRLDSTVFLRLDYNVNDPLRNPDRSKLQGSHLHMNVEGFRERCAKELPATVFSDFTDKQRTLCEFLKYCNVEEIPIIIWKITNATRSYWFDRESPALA